MVAVIVTFLVVLSVAGFLTIKVCGAIMDPSLLDVDKPITEPNPYFYDLTQYGLYTGTGSGIICSISAGTLKLTCPGGIGDFAIGQGIEIPRAGAAPTFNAWGRATISAYARTSNVATLTYSGPTFGRGQTISVAALADSTFNGTFTILSNDGQGSPYATYHLTLNNPGSNVSTTSGSGTATLTSPQVKVTPVGLINGATTYTYKVALRDYHGGISAASNAGKTTAGAATLGVNNSTVSSCSTASGMATCTTTSAHGFQTGVKVNVTGNAFIINGEHIIVSVPTSRTFTFYRTGYPDMGPVSGGFAAVKGKNLIQWNTQGYSGTSLRVLQGIVYRSVNGGPYSVAGVVPGMDGSFTDEGFGAPSVPIGVPSTPPSTTINGILATTITNISQTTLTIKAKAMATVTNVLAQHDNTPVVYAACAAMSSNGGTLGISVKTVASQPTFNSPLDWRNCPKNIELDVASSLAINDPWIMSQQLTLHGLAGGGATGEQFQAEGPLLRVYGNANPFLYWYPGNFGPTLVDHFSFNCNGNGQSCIATDQDMGGGGVVNVHLINNDYNGGPGSTPILLKGGGFDYWILRGFCQVVNSGGWGSPPCIEVNTPNSLGSQGNLYTVSGIMEVRGVRFAGSGVQFDDYGNSYGSATGNYTFENNFIESPNATMFSFFLYGANSTLTNLTFKNIFYADFVGGQGVPMFQTANSRLYGMKMDAVYCGSPNQPLMEGGSQGTSGVSILGSFADDCNYSGLVSGYKRSQNLTNQDQYIGNWSVQLSQGANLNYAMATPAAPSASVGSGGSVAVGNHSYTIAAVDVLGNQTVQSPAVSVTTTSGSQTVTITQPSVMPPGAVGFVVYRDGVKPLSYRSGPGACNGFTPINTTFSDAFASICGNLPVTTTTAGASVIGPTGLSSAVLIIAPTNFVNLGTPNNGTLYYCPDCTITNPCAGAGTGALAKRLNGVWVCN